MIKRTFENGHVPIVEHGGVLYLGGVAADDISQNFAGQMRQVTQTLDKVLAVGGSSRAHILHAKVNLADFSDKVQMDRIWREWIADTDLPSRSTNGGIYIGEGVLVEVVLIAAVAE